MSPFTLRFVCHELHITDRLKCHRRPRRLRCLLTGDRSASSSPLPTDLHLLPSRRAISSLFGSSMFAHEKALTSWFVVCCCCYWRPIAIKSHFLCRLHPRNVNSQPNFCSSLRRATVFFALQVAVWLGPVILSDFGLITLPLPSLPWIHALKWMPTTTSVEFPVSVWGSRKCAYI